MEFELKGTEFEIHKNRLQELLPKDYKGKIIKFQNLVNGLSCTLRMPFYDKTSALTWLKDFQNQNNVLFRVMRTHEENTQKIIYKKEFRCVYNMKKRKGTTPRPQHLNCNAKLTITIKQPTMKKSQDTYLKSHPCEILLRHCHNHPLDLSTCIKHSPPEEIKNQFIRLFENGHSPKTALSIFHSENCDKSNRSSNGSTNEKWVYDLYYNIFKKKYSEPSPTEITTVLQNCISKYNEECGDLCALTDETEGLTVAICTPVMKRVHENIETAGHAVFVDSTGLMNYHNVRVWLLQCLSPIGALPLGVIITSVNKVQIGINLLKKVLSGRAFFNKLEPETIVVDDDACDLNEISSSFTNTKVLLCQYYVLKTITKFLWNVNNRLPNDSKISIYNNFKQALYSTTENEFTLAYEKLLNDECVLNNSEVFAYFKNFISTVQIWALCYRTNESTVKYPLNTYKVLENKIMYRKNPYSLLQIFEYITISMEQFYIGKISDILNNYKIDTTNACSIKKKVPNDLRCEWAGSDFYHISLQGKEYFVNRKIELCTCNLRNTKPPCKHVVAVIQKYGYEANELQPMDNSFKDVLYKVIGQSHDTSYEDPDFSAELTRDDVCDKLQNLFTLLIDKYENKFVEYSDAIVTFINNFEECRTDKDLILALKTFGTSTQQTHGDTLIEYDEVQDHTY